ncbi:MAG: hypothetical protein V4546_01580 [Bacteroidota bacterium]
MNARFNLLLFLTIFGLTAFGQTIKDVQQKMSHNPNLPDQRFISNFSKQANSVSLRYQDIKSISFEKLKQVEDIEFLELGFENQSQLNELASFLGSFRNLKYLSFTYDDYFSKESTNEIIVPKQIANLKKVIAVKFAGKWKVNFQKSFETLRKLPKLSYYLFQSFNDEIPRELLTVTVKGISLHSKEKSEVPTWIADLKGLETIAIDMVSYRPQAIDRVNYNEIFKFLSSLPKLKSLYITGFYEINDTIATTKFPLLEDFSISEGEIKSSASFFKFIGGLSKLVTLSLSSIKYDTLRNDLVRLGRLKRLDLLGSYNLKQIIGLDLGSLKSLTHLKMRSFAGLNDLNTLPPQLQYLDLTGNELARFPIAIIKLKSLRYLQLSYNSIAHLPQEISNLSELKSLGLNSNQLSALPNSIGYLHKLNVLILTANPLKSLPNNFGELGNLQHLDLRYCDLDRLPSSFINMKKLNKLDLSYNFLTSVPEDFQMLKSLDSLSLEKNALTHLPSKIGELRKLKHLNVASNKIQHLPNDFGQMKLLKELNLSANNLVELPASFANLSLLEKIYLAGGVTDQKDKKDPFRENYRKDSPYAAYNGGSNQIAALPNDLSRWKHLKKIDLSNLTNLGNEAILALRTISSNGYSIEFENGNITELPKDGWSKFNVGVLNLRNNKIKELPRDIVNAPFLSSYNFNQNRLPSKPINQNSYAANKYQKLAWFTEFGFIDPNKLPIVDSMALALVEKSSSHYYRKEFKQSVEAANQAIRINRELALGRIIKGNLGEANYQIGKYNEAIELLTAAIKRDTAGNVRIMNFVVPNFEFRAKSFLKIGDTLSAIKDYETLALNNWSDSWAETGLLYAVLNDKEKSKIAFEKGIKKYQSQIDYGKKQKNNIELEQLSLLELLIIAEKFIDAEKYAQELKKDIKSNANLTILAYLNASVKIALNKSEEVDETGLMQIISTNKKTIESWSYELFFKWLRVTKIDEVKAKHIRRITDAIKP